MEDILDKATVLERVGGDEELLSEIVGLFLDDCPRLVEDVRAAVQAKDPAQLKMAAHTLKGAISNFAAQAAFEAALRLERLGASGDLGQADLAFAELELQIRRLQPAIAALALQSTSV